ncbi:MAG: DinB family protein [Planctomycetes bacterium]|nr:DinB family protein [Planctomycetota bacterium]
MTRTFVIDEAAALLRRTPRQLDAWLRDLPAAWLDADEGPGTWRPRDVVGHLIAGERTDWMARVHHLLRHGDVVAFAPFDREAQFKEPPRALGPMLDEFAARRAQNVDELLGLGLTAADLDRTGRHPAFGVVTLGQHLATWVAHDLTHVTQIARVMAKRYHDDVGPWREYLRVVRS